MIYITGDLHGDIDIGKLSAKAFPQQKTLTKDDYVIVCGDFGLVWDDSSREHYWRKWLSKKNFTTLFVDGNHENFPLLRTFPTVEKFGGQVRQITPSVFHLERGQVLQIDEHRFFVMGGAASHDKEWRTEGVSWWPEEIPSKEEMERGIKALEMVDWKVDFVLTHCAPKCILPFLNGGYGNDTITSYLNFIFAGLEFKRWFFGHYHISRQLNEQFFALYKDIIPLPGSTLNNTGGNTL